MLVRIHSADFQVCTTYTAGLCAPCKALKAEKMAGVRNQEHDRMAGVRPKDNAGWPVYGTQEDKDGHWPVSTGTGWLIFPSAALK